MAAVGEQPAVPALDAKPPNPVAVKLRGELEFVRRLLTSSTSVGEYKAAAHAAARVAEAALKAVPQSSRASTAGADAAGPGPGSADAGKPATGRRGKPQPITITVRNLPTDGEWTWYNFRKWLQEHPRQIKVPHVEKWEGSDWALLRLDTEQDVAAAKQVLGNGLVLPGCTVPVVVEDGEPSDIAAQRAERKASNTRSKGGKRQLESKDEQAGAKEARLEAAAGEGQQAQ